jgi:hypothetical protein
MSHVLEHLPYADIIPVLQRVRSWMQPGSELVVEVPDMGEIMRQGEMNSLWLCYIYGSQEHEGEFHRSGFTEILLPQVLEAAGFQKVAVRKFLSDHPYRDDMPCLEATCRA